MCFSLSYYKILNVLSTEVVNVWKSDCAVNTNFPKISKRHFGSRLKEYQKAVFFDNKENSALSEHTCLTNHTSGWDNSKLITTNRRYHQRFCLEAWHINSAHAPSNCDDGGLLPDAYLHFV